MGHHLTPWSDDRGETLVELIVTVAILGVAGVAILAGLMTSVQASVLHRNDATGGAYVRSFAEAIQTYVDANGLAACGPAAATTYAGVAVADLPPGYTKEVTGLVRSWNGSAWDACTADRVQRLDLKVTTTGDAAHRAEETLTIILRKPCNGNAATAVDNPCS